MDGLGNTETKYNATKHKQKYNNHENGKCKFGRKCIEYMTLLHVHPE